MNYSERDVRRMLDIYTEKPGLDAVDQISILLNKPRKSVIAKLVKEGVYETQGYRSKTGERPITKLAIVRSIEDALNVSLPGLDKAPKDTLKVLKERIK